MRRQDWMLNQLPTGMLSDDFFSRFVSIFQAEAGTLLAHGDNLEHLVDPTVTPPAMVRWIATWIGMDAIDAALPEAMQRRILTTASRTLAWRGTRSGLQAFLELFSGGPAVVEDGGGVWRPDEAPADAAWVVLRVASTGGMPEQDFVALVADEVPAHVRAELWVDDRRVWPQDTTGPGGAGGGPASTGTSTGGTGGTGTSTGGTAQRYEEDVRA